MSWYQLNISTVIRTGLNRLNLCKKSLGMLSFPFEYLFKIRGVRVKEPWTTEASQKKSVNQLQTAKTA